MELMRATVGCPRPGELKLSIRQRIDFGIVTLLFSVLVGA